MMTLRQQCSRHMCTCLSALHRRCIAITPEWSGMAEWGDHALQGWTPVDTFNSGLGWTPRSHRPPPSYRFQHPTARDSDVAVESSRWHLTFLPSAHLQPCHGRILPSACIYSDNAFYILEALSNYLPRPRNSQSPNRPRLRAPRLAIVPNEPHAPRRLHRLSPPAPPGDNGLSEPQVVQVNWMPSERGCSVHHG